MTGTAGATVTTLDWVGDVDGHLSLIDQTLLPVEVSHIECRDVGGVCAVGPMVRSRHLYLAAGPGTC